MMKLLMLLLISTLFSVEVNAQREIKVITIVESIVPMGIGRSRIIEEKADIDAEKLKLKELAGTHYSKDVPRQEVRIEGDEYEQTKLLNFFSGGGINLKNIASNDAIISEKINSMLEEGWSLAFVTSGVESYGGLGDINGIFITRLFFSKE